VRNLLHSIWVAVQFLTLLPIPNLKGFTWDDKRPLQAVFAYPLVGLLLGLLLYAAALALPNEYPWVTGIVIALLWSWLTGGLHLDGLADSADGWMGGLGDRSRTLSIMKDPHIGVTGSMALVTAMLLKASLVGVIAHQAIEHWLIWIPILARTCAIILMATTPYVSEKGIGTGWISRVGMVHFTWACCILMVVSLLIPHAFLLVVSIIGILILLRAMMMRRLKGCTGDTIGATIEITELTALFYVYAGIS
jgi:adenosylcobinamide-GDP ribazoletransferase